jgi:hypothetical protein
VIDDRRIQELFVETDIRAGHHLIINNPPSKGTLEGQSSTFHHRPIAQNHTGVRTVKSEQIKTDATKMIRFDYSIHGDFDTKILDNYFYQWSL